ncbi:MAG: tetratricopeptide repeat protein [Boseongicola sp.]
MTFKVIRPAVALLSAAAMLAVLAGANPAVAAGSDGSSGDSSASALQIQDEIRAAQKFINSRRYSSAIQTLRAVVKQDTQNADAYNLLGFASRKLEKTEDAAKYYEAALEIKPDHLGALEYQGELFLMIDEPAKANANLEKLLELCGMDCHEYLDLKADIADFQGSS